MKSAPLLLVSALVNNDNDNNDTYNYIDMSLIFFFTPHSNEYQQVHVAKFFNLSTPFLTCVSVKRARWPYEKMSSGGPYRDPS